MKQLQFYFKKYKMKSYFSNISQAFNVNVNYYFMNNYISASYE